MIVLRISDVGSFIGFIRPLVIGHCCVEKIRANTYWQKLIRAHKQKIASYSNTLVLLCSVALKKKKK
jgi:hypothetical protein